MWPGEGRAEGLDGRVALVTGAGSGIGLATSRLLAARGAAVALVDIDEARAGEAAAMLRASGARAVAVGADVSVAAEVHRVVGIVRAELGAISILVNNAGIIRRASVPETTEAEWDRVLAVNLKSVFLCSQAVLPSMRESGGGAIVNVASGWGLAGGARAAAYCASKGAVVLLTKAMAIDHGPEGIRVNCVCPGDTDTPLLAAEAGQLGEPAQRFRQEAARRPLGRIGRPEEVARAVLYLASEASSFVTGVALIVDGGGLAGTL